jgi:hypothetical protein
LRLLYPSLMDKCQAFLSKACDRSGAAGRVSSDAGTSCRQRGNADKTRTNENEETTLERKTAPAPPVDNLGSKSKKAKLLMTSDVCQYYDRSSYHCNIR